MEIIEDFHGTCKELKNNTEFKVNIVEFNYQMIQRFRSFVGKNRLNPEEQEITLLELEIDKGALKYIEQYNFEWNLQGCVLLDGLIYRYKLRFITIKNGVGTNFSNSYENFILIPNFTTRIYPTSFNVIITNEEADE